MLLLESGEDMKVGYFVFNPEGDVRYRSDIVTGILYQTLGGWLTICRWRAIDWDLLDNQLSTWLTVYNNANEPSFLFSSMKVQL